MSGWIKDEDVVAFVRTLKHQIKNELGLPISIGIAKTKWIAKLGTNAAKPNGVKLIKAKDFINTNRLFIESHFKQEMIDMFNAIDMHPIQL